MTTIEHSLKFVTHLDESDPTAQRLLALPKEMQIQMLESLLKEVMSEALAPAIEEINKGGSWAILEMVA